MDHAFVVMAFGHSPFLEGCLADLSRQSLRSKIAVVTSTPSARLEALAARVGADYFVNGAGGGIGADWNFGLRITGARYVTLVHQDDVYDARFLEESMNLLSTHGAALSFTGYEEVNAHGKRTNSKLSRVKHLMDAFALGGARCPPLWRMRLYLSFGVALPCSSVTYDLSQLDGFSFATSYEANLDWDAWLRLIRARKVFARTSARLVGRRHNDLTATSRALVSGARRREDQEMFRRIWPRPLADLIAVAYRTGY